MAIKWAQGPTSLRIFCKFGARVRALRACAAALWRPVRRRSPPPAFPSFQHDEPGEKNLKIRHIDVSMGGWAPSDPNKQWLTKRVGIRAKGEDAIYQLDLPLFRKIAAGNSTWERKPEGIVLTLDKAQWGGAKWPRLQRKDVRVPRSQHLWYNEQGDMDLEWDECVKRTLLPLLLLPLLPLLPLPLLPRPPTNHGGMCHCRHYYRPAASTTTNLRTPRLFPGT